MTLNVSNQTNFNTKKIEKLQKKQNKGGIGATALAIGGSSMVNAFGSLPGSIIAEKSLSKYSSNLTSEQIQQIFESANNFIKSKGLDKKGVVINNCTNAGINLSGLPDKLYEALSPIFATAKGKNAFYTDKPIKSTLGDILYDKNSIVINMKKLPNAVFHEIGHAINNNTSKFWKALQKMRMPGMLLASMLVLFSAVTNKTEAKDGKELTKAQKVKNAIRDNAGKLSFAAMVPMLLEEGMASIRGCKWANSNLPKELAKKVLKTNLGAYCSYLGVALSLALTAFSAVKIKDYFGKKHQEKVQAKIDAQLNKAEKSE